IFWPGTREQSIEYIVAAAAIIRAHLPKARIGSNSTTQPGFEFLDQFLTERGPTHFTDVCMHPYVQGSQPENMFIVFKWYRDVMAKHGISHYPLRSTENGWHQWYDNGVPVNDQWAPNPGTDIPLPPQMAANYIVRAHLVALLGRLRQYIHW